MTDLLLEQFDLSDADIVYMSLKDDPVTWCLARRKLRGRVMEFNGPDPQDYREFLVEPLRDNSKRKCKKKGRQVGETESGMSEILHKLDSYDYINIMYILPTERLVEDFSNQRLRQAIDESPYLKARVGTIKDGKGRKVQDGVDNVTLKQIGKSFLFMRPSSTKRLGEGTPVDAMYIDEIDSCSNIEALMAHKESLSASKLGIERQWSTPTIPDYGIAKTFSLSDQRIWLNRCRRCGEYQQIIYPDSLVCLNDRDQIYEYQCLRCHDTHHLGKPIMDRYDGKYVPRVTDRVMTWRGYFVSQLQAPWISATEIMRKKREEYELESLFFNYVLGEEYLGDNVLITAHDIESCIVDLSLEETEGLVKKSGKIIKGTDWGKISWQLCGIPVKIGLTKKLLIYDIRVYFDDDENTHVSRMITENRREGVRLMVNDAGYGRAKNRELSNFFPQRVFSCFYPSSEFDTANRIIKPVWNDDQQKVSVHRTTQISVYLQQYKNMNIMIPKYLASHPYWTDFKNHHTSLVKIRRIHEKKRIIEEKIVSLRDDHLGHAGTYLWTAFERVATDWRSEVF